MRPDKSLLQAVAKDDPGLRVAEARMEMMGCVARASRLVSVARRPFAGRGRQLGVGPREIARSEVADLVVARLGVLASLPSALRVPLPSISPSPLVPKGSSRL